MWINAFIMVTFSPLTSTCSSFDLRSAPSPFLPALPKRMRMTNQPVCSH